MGYPKYLPKDCPPDNARSAYLKVYRAVNNNPPKIDDFLPFAIKTGIGKVNCEKAAISVNTQLEDLRHKKKALPGLAKSYKFIAEGFLKLHTKKTSPM